MTRYIGLTSLEVVEQVVKIMQRFPDFTMKFKKSSDQVLRWDLEVNDV